MALPPLPFTPGAISSRDSSISSPGTWRHPRLKEIVRRQHASRFSSRNVQLIVWNGGTLILTSFIGKLFKQYSLALGSFLQISTYPDATLLLIRLFLLCNIAYALYPLYRPRDEVSDIPLTPSQRALLGLDPNNTPPATPGSTYITPPRYRLSTGSRRASSGSPTFLNSRDREVARNRRPSDSSQFSPSDSPLFQKGLRANNRDNGGRRHSISIGSPSPLGRTRLNAGDGNLLRAPSSPSSSFGMSSTTSLYTHKWLYERTRMVPPGESIYSP
ncbi:hypothetical protein FQN57_001975 [Myotisia sp. PD_48]|nr:hypothetical protein FQN57_001975 [Myotisia sp. PD_48]